MVATDRAVGRAREKKRRLPFDLPWLVAGLSALAARDVLAQSSIDARFLFYKESGGRTQVLDPMVLLHQDFGASAGQVDLLVGFDAISGASPSGGYPTADVTTSASGKLVNDGSIPQVQYQDQRKSASLSYARKFGAHLPSVDFSYAKENDYTARSYGFSDSWILSEGRATLHFGASLARDVVAPVTNDLRLSKSTNGFSLGLTWIVDEKNLFDVSASVMELYGYLDDPYKIVPVGPVGTAESLPDHRPDTRSRRALVLKYGHHFEWDAAVKATYRYYNDSWSLQAHTLEVTYDHRLSPAWIVSPQIRIYTQTGASFYGSLISSPRTYRSADYRLSPLYSVLGGLTLSHRIDERLGVSLGATVQAQQGRDRVIPVSTSPTNAGRAPSTSAADLTVTTMTLGLTWSY